MPVVSSHLPGSEDKVAACPPTATSSTKKPVSTYWYPGADSKTSHSRCRPASWCTRDRRGPEPSADRSAGGNTPVRAGAEAQVFPGPVMPGRLSRYASSIQPGRGRRKQGRVWPRCNPTKVMIAGEGYVGLPLSCAQPRLGDVSSRQLHAALSKTNATPAERFSED
jgi:hypothetical protein